MGLRGDYVKRLVAKRRLKHGCDQCRNPILKGHIYYRKRTVFQDYDTIDKCGIFAVTTTYCPKCKYTNEQRNVRFEKFKKECKHPKEFINEVWTYVPGEAVKEPSHCECMLCGSYL